jgi:excinuclease ABC subunit C
MRAFDKKFGPEFVAQLPTTAGVYRVFAQDGSLIYIGKAKNLRRRLGQYRNAKRRKKHLKMRNIIADAARIEIEHCASDLEACLLEAKLIQELRPRWNTAGAFYFLYPMIGIRWEQDQMFFCYTTQPEHFADFELHGAFRSRGISGRAFWALMDLLSYVGHRIPRNKKRVIPKYSYVVGFRRLPEAWMERWRALLAGDSHGVMEDLVLALVENAGARRSGREVQEALNRIKIFWRHEALVLKKARDQMGYPTYPVSQKERDFLFLKRRFQKASVLLVQSG